MKTTRANKMEDFAVRFLFGVLTGVYSVDVLMWRQM